MWESLKSLFGFGSANEHPASRGQAWTQRQGEFVPVDEAFEAWTSFDLPRMLAAVDTKTNQVDRHFLLMNIVGETYRLRADPAMAQKCAEVAQIHVDEFPAIRPALKREFGGTLPRVSTFQQYATLLTERGDFDAAIHICKVAQAFGLDDGTKGGYAGRIERIKNKAATSNT
jgi:hypothetical protein